LLLVNRQRLISPSLNGDPFAAAPGFVGFIHLVLLALLSGSRTTIGTQVIQLLKGSQDLTSINTPL
jgi:hypothetical protein